MAIGQEKRFHVSLYRYFASDPQNNLKLQILQRFWLCFSFLALFCIWPGCGETAKWRNGEQVKQTKRRELTQIVKIFTIGFKKDPHYDSTTSKWQRGLNDSELEARSLTH